MILTGQGEDAAMEYLRGELQTHGIIIEEADPNEIYTAIDEEYSAQKAMYSATHPDMVDADGELTAEGVSEFNDFYNNAVYGEATRDTEEGKLAQFDNAQIALAQINNNLQSGEMSLGAANAATVAYNSIVSILRREGYSDEEIFAHTKG
jgi:hypothetical protein